MKGKYVRQVFRKSGGCWAKDSRFRNFDGFTLLEGARGYSSSVELFVAPRGLVHAGAQACEVVEAIYILHTHTNRWQLSILRSSADGKP